MNAIKKFLAGLLFVVSFATVAHAEEVDPYFAWEIKNLDDYRRHDSVFKKMNAGGIIGLRDYLYKFINSGGYVDVAKILEVVSVYQKIAFGTNYFDAGFTEFNAKLYLEAGDFDAAERKINELIDHVSDDSSKIRLLILGADLYNRRENFSKALQATQIAAEFLKTAPDEKLSLLNQMHMARAYCGLGDTKSAARILNKIYQLSEKLFGTYSTVNFSMMSLCAELAHKTGHDDTAKDWLLAKCTKAYDIYEQADHSYAAAGSRVELATFYFDTGDTEKGIEILNHALGFTDELQGELGGGSAARRFYKKINAIALKNLGKDHKITLLSEYNLAYINSIFGAVPQAITFYEQNLPKFKKIFGEENTDTLDMMTCLKNDYLALGRYADAKKVAEEKLRICQKHFKPDASWTIYSTIQLAEIYYRMGKYKTADKLLADLQAENKELFEKTPPPNFVYDTMLKKAEGARLRGDLSNYGETLRTTDKLLEEYNPQYKENFLLTSHGIDIFLEASKFSSTTGLVHNTGNNEYIISNLANIMGANYNEKNLKLMNDIAELQIKYGDLSEANRYANQALKASRKNFGGNNLLEWTALNTLSKIRRAEGKFTDALNLDTKALQIAETVCGKNSLERLQSLDAMASDYAADGNLTEAIKIRERALAEYKKILEDTDAATVQMMTNLAENYVAVGRFADAINLCDETLAAQKMPIYTNNHLNFYPSVMEPIRIKAQAQKLSGDNTAAYSNYTNLIQAYEAQRTANSYINSGLSGAENKSKWFAGNVPVYKAAAAVAADKNAVLAFYCTELCKGRNLIDRFDDVLVTKNYLLTADEKNTLAENENILQAVQNLGEYADANNDEALALNVETVYANFKIFTEIFKSDLREKYAKNMVPKNSQKTADKKLNFFLFNLLDLSIWEQPSIWNWNELLKNFDVRKNQAAIPDDACLIEFMKTADDSLLVTFLRNEGDVQASNIPVDKNFFDKCLLYHELCSYPDITTMEDYSKFLWKENGKYFVSTERSSSKAETVPVTDNAEYIALRQKLAAELSDKLIPTLEKFAGNSAHWIISPDVELNLLPFETLNYRSKFLVQSKNLSYVPSLTVMNLMRNRERKNSYLSRSKELFAMGDAVYEVSGGADSRQSIQDFLNGLRGNDYENFDLNLLQWENLDGTALELDKVSTLFDNKAIFRREQVTEKKLRELNTSGELAKYKYLLFSTHGIFIPQKPELSAIVLNQQFKDSDHDGYITVGEWMGYDLRSDLIYLSACESGRGDYQAGEGIVGIPYALTMAGNKDTVMSLWKVDDTATADFTAAVFEKLSRGQSEVQALNETKREFLNQNNPAYKNPWVWAAFVLYGI